MINPFIRKLEAFGPLPDEDRQALGQSLGSTRQVGADRDLVREGDRPAACQLIGPFPTVMTPAAIWVTRARRCGCAC